MTQQFLTIMRSIAETDAVIGVRHKGENSVFFEVRTGDGRSQVLMASLSVTDDGEQIVHMMSEIGPASADLYERMLLHNLQLRYSKTSIVDHDGDKVFALVYSYPFAELEPVELAKAFGEIAFMADLIEKECFEVDHM